MEEGGRHKAEGPGVGTQGVGPLGIRLSGLGSILWAAGSTDTAWQTGCGRRIWGPEAVPVARVSDRGPGAWQGGSQILSMFEDTSGRACEHMDQVVAMGTPDLPFVAEQGRRGAE